MVFFSTEHNYRGRKKYLLYGMGGARKIQLALKFMEESREVEMTLPVPEAVIDTEAGLSTSSGSMRVPRIH